MIEAPSLAKTFSPEVFCDIADALDVDPADLITASLLPDCAINKTSKAGMMLPAQKLGASFREREFCLYLNDPLGYRIDN